MSIKKVSAYLCALALVGGLLAGCGKNETRAAGSDAGKSASTGGTGDNVAVPSEEDKIYLGLVAALTGTNKASGEMNVNGAQLAVDEINADRRRYFRETS